MNTSCHVQLKKQWREKKNDMKIMIIYYLEMKLKSQVHTKTNKQASKNQVQKRKNKLFDTSRNYNYKRKIN